MNKSEVLQHVDDVAKRLNLSPQKVRRLADTNELECFRSTRGDRLFLAETVERFKQNSRKSNGK